MSSADLAEKTDPPALLQRPQRADARRNYEKVLAAAREAFAQGGDSTSLEEIARRAGVGIGTLYRHFPTRQALIEAVYVDEVEAVCMSAAQLDGADPWEALNSWFERFIQYVATKQTLAGELLSCLGNDSEIFRSSRAALFAAGEPLLTRAQQAGVVRADVDIAQVTQLVVAIAKTPSQSSEQIEHLVRIALDGLRYRPDA